MKEMGEIFVSIECQPIKVKGRVKLKITVLPPSQ